MESTMYQETWQLAAEVELIYKTKVKSSDRPRIISSRDSYTLLKRMWNSNKIEFIEQFKVLLLNRASRVLGIYDASSGSVSGTVVDIRLIYLAAIKANACAIIIAHNHPSGSITPSRADEELTMRIREAGKVLDVRLLDHIIVTNEDYFSFADEGLV